MITARKSSAAGRPGTAHCSWMGGTGAPYRSRRAPGQSCFTLVETIGVLAVIALLLAVIAPSVVRRLDHAAWTKETSDIQAIADSYTQYILRTKTIPGTNTWASSVSDQMNLPVSAITTNMRGYARAFLIDTNLKIGANANSVLPFGPQSASGSPKPVSARVIIVSSLSGALPLSSGVPSSNEFNAIWNTADGAKPATSTWTTWAGNGDDLRIKRLNLEPLFHQLILFDRDPATNQVRFSIDSAGTNTVPAVGFNRYYLDGTVVGL